MSLEELLAGESKTIEYKKCLPNKSETYLKTILAFANTNGGKLLLGIDDYREVVGVDPQQVFAIMDAIANAISDSCTPQIIPNITFQNIHDKCVIIIDIQPSIHRPHYLRQLGMEKGTYVRIGSTTRIADETKIKELQLEGSHQYFDEMVCLQYPIEEKEIQRLCNAITSHRRKINEISEETVIESPTDFLCNLNLLRKKDHHVVATNGFALLVGGRFPFAKIQCAVFKGLDRDIFIDKKEYSGPLYEQIEQAYQFVLRHIDLHATIEGLMRKEQYEVPIDAIREMIVNAVTHRNYLANSCIQVAIFDNRIEVTSPGSLYGSLTLQEALQGRSSIRNRSIAEVFSRMGIIESWGTGIRRIMKRAQEYDLPAPEFIEFSESFRVIFYRKVADFRKADKKPIEKADRKPIEKADTRKHKEEIILAFLKDHETICNAEVRELLKIAESTSKRLLGNMVENGTLIAIGERRHRVYQLKNRK